MATPVREAFPPWRALEEIEKGTGKTFAQDPVRALRVVAGHPEPAASIGTLKVV
jgi:hypothetical protein